MRRDDEQPGDKGEKRPAPRQAEQAPPAPHAGQSAADHAHPGETEQEARIAGNHGWGYGGEPQDEAPSAPAEPTDEGRMGEIAPPDPGGHHQNWRR